MRWSSSSPDRQRPNLVRRWFALWPVTVGGETRWLERVTVEYQDSPYFFGEGYTGYRYKRIRFVDE
jgi:hypothetical protein